MLDPRQALRKILDNVRILSAERAALADACGRVLSRDLIARLDLPPFHNSAMDGYAVRAHDCRRASQKSPAVLRLKGVVAAGASPPAVQVPRALRTAGASPRIKVMPGEAAKIMTGAPPPEGADAVVRKEWTQEDPGGLVRIFHAPRRGDCIRFRGEDIRKGRKLLSRGAPLRPYEISLLAAQGISSVTVIRKPAVSILSTGDELAGPAGPAAYGKIRDSNGPALAAALAQAGISGLNGGIFPDDPVILTKAFKKFLERSDLMLITGGVSVGDYDYTRKLLERIGIKVVFWKVAIKPGKPLLFGRRGRKLVFGLPGNPLSALVCFEEFVRPALEKMQGLRPETFRYLHQGRLLNTYIKERRRAQCLFARASGRPERFKVRILLPQGSALLARAARANAMAWGPLGVRRLKKGDKILFRWLK